MKLDHRTVSLDVTERISRVRQIIMCLATNREDRGHRLGGWLIGILAFLAFFGVIGSWSLAAPYNGTPDEMSHIFRASGVVSGDITPPPEPLIVGSGAYQTVPAGLIVKGCWQFYPNMPAACAPPPTADGTPVRVASAAGRYPPLYYALVGWPLWLWPGWTGVLLARLISAALSAVLLTGALVTILRWSKHRLMLAGLLVACTPMVAHMSSAVNPNGLEIAAGASFFAGAIPLFLSRHRDPPAPGLVWLVGISGVLLATLRASGPLWVIVALMTVLVPLDIVNLRTLWRSRSVRFWAGAILVALTLSVAWTEIMKAGDLGDFRGGVHLSLSKAVITEIGRWGNYLDQMVGVTSWLDTYLPSPVYRVWQFMAAALFLWAVVLGQRADRLRLVILLLGGVVVPSTIQVMYVNINGFITQGRYMLPVLVGIPLLSTWVLEQRSVSGDQARTVKRLAVVLLIPIHLIALLYTMVRWQKGLPPTPGLTSFNLLSSAWQPPAGWVAPLMAEVVGLLLVACLIWSSSQALRLAQPQAVNRAGRPAADMEAVSRQA